MNKEFVTYEQALSLKELGFDEPCFSIYYSKNKSFSWHHHKDHTNDEPMLDNGEFNISAPLKQQVFRWFRDKYDLWFRPDYYDEMREYDYQGSIHQLGRYSSLASLDNCKTVEELEAKCIDKLIEIVKNK